MAAADRDGWAGAVGYLANQQLMRRVLSPHPGFNKDAPLVKKREKYFPPKFWRASPHPPSATTINLPDLNTYPTFASSFQQHTEGTSHPQHTARGSVVVARAAGGVFSTRRLASPLYPCVHPVVLCVLHARWIDYTVLNIST